MTDKYRKFYEQQIMGVFDILTKLKEIYPQNIGEGHEHVDAYLDIAVIALEKCIEYSGVDVEENK